MLGSAGGPGTLLGQGSGAVAGALSAEERRRKVLEAAERRQQNVPGVSQQKTAELRERKIREELLGKLTEHYGRKKMDMPMGLNLASSEQLRKHWEQVRASDSSAQVLGGA